MDAVAVVADSPVSSAREALSRRTEDLFRQYGALRTGHFKLHSGRHSSQYVEKFHVLQHPHAVEELCQGLVSLVKSVDGYLPDVVCGPTTGGVVLAYEVARQLGVRSIFAEERRQPDGTKIREFRRGFRMAHGERVYLVDDIWTTGSSLRPMVPAIEAFGATIILVAVLVDRSGQLDAIPSPTGSIAYPADALLRLDLPTWEPGEDTCPECESGVVLETPGSSGASH